MNDVTSRYPTEDVEKPRIVILISGSGSNMLTIVDQVTNGTIDAEVAGIICNEPEAATGSILHWFAISPKRNRSA